MAKPIQPTPTLEGKDAENFFKELARVKTREEIEEKMKLFEESDRVFKLLGKHLIKKMIS